MHLQERALEHAAELFEEGDTDKNGVLSCNEIVLMMRKVWSKFQVGLLRLYIFYFAKLLWIVRHIG